MIALHGADAAVHDYHTGRVGSFVEAIAALEAARRGGDAIEVATAITRSSYRGLAQLPGLLHAHRVASWRLAIATFTDPVPVPVSVPVPVPVSVSVSVSVSVPVPVSVPVADRLVPRLAMALPFALHAIDRATRLGIAVTIVDAPRCLLGPLAAHAVMTAPRAYPAPCEHCAARPHCPGVDAAYLARFGAGELTPQ